MVDGRMHACGPASRPARHPLVTEPEESSAKGDVECGRTVCSRPKEATSKLLLLFETNIGRRRKRLGFECATACPSPALARA